MNTKEYEKAEHVITLARHLKKQDYDSYEYCKKLLEDVVLPPSIYQKVIKRICEILEV